MAILNSERERLAKAGIVIRMRNPDDPNERGRHSPEPGRVAYDDNSDEEAQKVDL
jgi:hypothetical protein